MQQENEEHFNIHSTCARSTRPHFLRSSSFPLTLSFANKGDNAPHLVAQSAPKITSHT
jgi:hypothetical protein